MRRDFSITENYIRYLAGRVWFLNETISNLTAGTVEQRLAGFLLERPASGIPSSMAGLARQLNVGRASLYRAMDALEAEGLIRRDGKTLTVLDWEGLRARTR